MRLLCLLFIGALVSCVVAVAGHTSQGVTDDIMTYFDGVETGKQLVDQVMSGVGSLVLYGKEARSIVSCAGCGGHPPWSRAPQVRRHCPCRVQSLRGRGSPPKGESGCVECRGVNERRTEAVGRWPQCTKDDCDPVCTDASLRAGGVRWS